MIARLLGDRPSPSAALYLLNALGAEIGLRRRAHTVFETDAAVVVVRHDAGAPVARTEGRRLIYVLDDAVFAGVSDATLPASYRLKLLLTECAAARRLLPRAEAVVVSSWAVADALPRGLVRPGAQIAQIDPYWSEPPSDLRHWREGGALRIGFTGAQTHVAGLRLAAPAAAALLAAHPEAILYLSRGRRPPAPLRGHPRLRRFGGSWTDYRASIADRLRHLALYPVADTPFARARSTNKLIEHGLMGAAPLYSDHWPPARAAVAAGAGLALPAEPGAWTEAALALAADPARMRAMAAATAALARRLNDPAPQRALWARLLAP